MSKCSGLFGNNITVSNISSIVTVVVVAVVIIITTIQVGVCDKCRLSLLILHSHLLPEFDVEIPLFLRKTTELYERSEK